MAKLYCFWELSPSFTGVIFGEQSDPLFIFGYISWKQHEKQERLFLFKHPPPGQSVFILNMPRLISGAENLGCRYNVAAVTRDPCSQCLRDQFLIDFHAIKCQENGGTQSFHHSIRNLTYSNKSSTLMVSSSLIFDIIGIFVVLPGVPGSGIKHMDVVSGWVDPPQNCWNILFGK